MNVLVAGGAGYIGSHAVRQLLDAGHRVAAVDNLFRGHRQAVDRRAAFHEIDLADTHALAIALAEHSIDCVMHFAALAYVGESVTDPLAYYYNNTAGTISLLEGDEGRGREAVGVQFHLRHLRRAGGDADRRDDASGAGQSLRLVEVVRRAGAARLRRRRQGVSPSPPCAISTWPARRPTVRWARTTTPETHLIPVLLLGGAWENATR